jgi:ankyrin repeat protein
MGYAEDAVKMLLEKGADANARNKTGRTALIDGLMWPQRTQVLLDHGADIDIQDNNGWTALMTASNEGQHDVMRLLLNRGANARHQNKEGKDALMLLIDRSQNGGRKFREVAPLLLAHGADVNTHDSSGDTALIIAARNQDRTAVPWLLQNGADANARTNAGSSALMETAFNHTNATNSLNQLFVAEVLYGYGADIHARDRNARTALMVAAEWGQTDMVRWLLTYGAGPNERTNTGDTPLTLTADGLDYVGTARLLLQNGAQINARNKKGQTALMLATTRKNRKIVELLKQAGAKQ